MRKLITLIFPGSLAVLAAGCAHERGKDDAMKKEEIDEEGRDEKVIFEIAM